MKKIAWYLILIALCTSAGKLHASHTAVQRSEKITRQIVDHELDASFFVAVANGFVQKVEEMLAGERIPDIEFRYTEFDNTPLMQAVLNRRTDVARLLIAHGAHIETTNNYKSTPLIAAAGKGYYDLAKLLIESGANIEAEDTYNKTPLTWAAHRENYAIVRLLVAAGADPELENSRGVKPINLAKNKAAFTKAVQSGLADRNIAASVFAEEFEEPSITELITDYAYGQSPHDLPETKAELEQKECAAEKK